MHLRPFRFDPVRKESSKDNKITKVLLGREETPSTCQARHCSNQASCLLNTASCILVRGIGCMRLLSVRNVQRQTLPAHMITVWRLIC